MIELSALGGLCGIVVQLPPSAIENHDVARKQEPRAATPPTVDAVTRRVTGEVNGLKIRAQL